MTLAQTTSAITKGADIMKRLILLRHAKAEEPRDGLPDQNRRLVQKGRSDAVEIARRTKAKGFSPDAIFSSPALRARETVRIFASELGYRESGIEYREELYGEPSGRNCITLAKSAGNPLSCIIIAGHDPSISESVRYLSRNFHDNMPTCGIAVIDFAVEAWESIGAHEGELVHFDFPGNG